MYEWLEKWKKIQDHAKANEVSLAIWDITQLDYLESIQIEAFDEAQKTLSCELGQIGLKCKGVQQIIQCEVMKEFQKTREILIGIFEKSINFSKNLPNFSKL